MNIYDKIDVMFSGEAEDKPKWADEILTQLDEIKILLQEQKLAVQKYENKKLGVDFQGLLYDKVTLKYLTKKRSF